MTVSHGATALPALRRWQRSALNRYLRAAAADFMVVATPGAGKTTLALRAVHDLMQSGAIGRVVVVTPTDHLKSQWANAAAAFGIRLDPRFSATAGYTSRGFDGVVVTYAGVASAPATFKRMCLAAPTIVILDEIHHVGDAKSWGTATRAAFEDAHRRISLTGTPFRSDDEPIPFVTYEDVPGGGRRSVADYTYGYAEALADRVVRPVLFMSYSGEARWRTKAGHELAMRLGAEASADLQQQAWRTALSPEGDWIPAVLRAAHTRLQQIRGAADSSAGGLVIASDQSDARAYAELLTHITGTRPTLVLSDERGGSQQIAKFTRSDDEWIVAVRMVSEGVDIPRLGVLVYATNISTPMFFAQAVGRVIRSRRQADSATVFLPSIPRLRVLAHEMEVAREHVLGVRAADDEWDEVSDLEPASDADDSLDQSIEHLGASADFQDVIYEGNAWGSGADLDAEQEFLGIPGLLEPDQVQMLLQRRQRDQVRRVSARAEQEPVGQTLAADRPHHEVVATLRKELAALVSLRSARTGNKHALVHAELRRACGGPPTPLASAEQLQERIDYLRENRG